MNHAIPELDKNGLRKFGLTTGAIVAALFGLLLPWLFEHSIPTWPWVVAGVLVTLALAAPTTLRPVYKVWMKVGNVLGWINTRIILAILFYLLIVPVGILMRVLGKDPMRRSINPDADTYRVPSKPPPKRHLERPF